MQKETATPKGPKGAIFLALAYLAGALAVTFTQQFHESVVVNRAIVAVFFVLFAAAAPICFNALTAHSKKNKLSSWALIAVAAISVVLAIFALFDSSAMQLTLTLLIWAAVSTVFFVYAWLTTSQSAFRLMAIVSGALAILLVFNLQSLLMAMGFFAAAGLIIGVYLMIASFDSAEISVRDTSF